MKQIEKTGRVLIQLRKAYGPDADLSALAVFETTLVNTKPLRKTGGIFKGARLAASLMAEITNAVNAESIPIQLQHDTSTQPFGRLFAAAMHGLEEVRALFAVDQKANPEIVQKIDSGTLDQVSVGMINKQLLCNACGFDYMSPKAYEARWALECDKEHKLGENGNHVVVTGLDQLFETSLVGHGAVRGARIVGPSESIFRDNPKLAASAAEHGGFGALYLTATVEDENMDLAQINAQLTTQLTTATSAQAVAETKLTAATEQVTQLTGQVTQLTTERNEALSAKTTAETALTGVTAERDAANAAVSTALTALTAEATAVLTACGKSTDEIALALKDKDCAAVLSILQENRAQFAAVIPAGGRSQAADTKPNAPARPAGSSFTTRR
ncbi:hypothetical protein CPT_Seuss11 [Caulobacter phage Seuss]|uniref:Uncharacterized protein n=1 Tax=Caulobacter phage Seuss TaxID=1675601 RepID=A0A0K1LLZ5_9CAUD|nr:hypothetical protein HOR08_gp011 [Caulobacter phage Seuss]AKU43537.1 hypothetical protein CPT_Seuss11 [Caulobacter phage Seuss]